MNFIQVLFRGIEENHKKASLKKKPDLLAEI